MRRQSFRALFALAAAGGALLGLLRLGQWARARLDQREHYALDFAALRCEPPPGTDRATFLAEVQYLGGLPDRVNLLEPGLAPRLVGAFALHPWVERVEGVSLRGPEGPCVRLRLRTPALAAAGRVLDANGVLLPPTAPADGLPALREPVPPPAGLAGAPWGDARVEGAARTAALLQPLQECLRLTEVEITPDGLEFRGGVRVGWGRPGAEPTAEAKLARLRELCERHGGPDGPERPRDIDLRRVE
jgi:hypothetical protein